jgi:hypothetical protein
MGGTQGTGSPHGMCINAEHVINAAPLKIEEEDPMRRITLAVTILLAIGMLHPQFGLAVNEEVIAEDAIAEDAVAEDAIAEDAVDADAVDEDAIAEEAVSLGQETEPNDSCFTATHLGRVSGPFILNDRLDSISGAPGVDFFLFTSTPGVRVSVDLAGEATGHGTLPDPFLGLFDSNCNLLATNDDSGTLNSRLVFPVPADGVYVLAATACCDSSFTEGGVGTYRLTIVPSRNTCDGRIATIVGTAGNDVITGTPGNDVIHGLDGNDLIRGLGGNDVICGGRGNDTLFGGPGNDVLFGNDGNDRLFGDAGNDRLHGAGGNDSLSGGTGNDNLLGETGNDMLTGDAGNDTLNGGTGNDRLNGGPGRDICSGSLGTDANTGGCEVRVSIP